ncbi:MAG: c-type cytochrome [Planctomycetia bacterium]|nr:c-type cytochrome [Planctomycetia bacterium]
MRRFPLVGCLLLACAATAFPADGNRLTYLDESDPYYVHRTFPKLTTPQWVGEEGVEAVVILAIDDMKDVKKYETFLRPILDRLKKIDGRAPVSIMTCSIDPQDPHLQTWLKEGVSLETHTFDHPCPLLKDGDFKKAKGTYDKCVDLLASVPNSKPVAFRMPCCDSLNTNSPRFYAEIFNQRTDGGNYLHISTSVFNIFTSADPDLPRDLVLDADGQEKFRKYIPANRSFVNTIENYPYPYVIGKMCWEFPCMVPSDWEAQNLHKSNNPLTLRDWKAALDCTVIKQGVFNMVFHPHGWSTAEQFVELIDHAVTKHGKKVKFLTFKEAHERLTKNLLAGKQLRLTTSENGVRLLDLNNDGYLDVVIANAGLQQSRLWLPKERKWLDSEFPVELLGNRSFYFGVVRENGYASLFSDNEVVKRTFHFDGTKWTDNATDRNLTGSPVPLRWRAATSPELHRGVRLRDLDGDGICEVIVHDFNHREIFTLNKDNSWTKLPFVLPTATNLYPKSDDGLRFVDLNGDGRDDIVVSNEKEFGVYLFIDMKEGWRKVVAGKPGDPGALPMITRDGKNMGAWFHSKHLWVQNEHTNLLPNLVDRRSFAQLLGKEGAKPQAVEPKKMPDGSDGPKSPEESLKCIKVPKGFVVEQVVAEPLVQDPVAFAWGRDGKFWVVEMGDYPLGVDGKGKPGGKIKFLEASKGDGKYDKATVFLEDIPFPTGVLPWRNGVLVTAAPDIFYAEDTDGDGKADTREVLFTGFVEGNQQHRVNGLVFGVDNWVYCANGDSGGKVKSMKTGKVVDIRGRDFRIRPDSGEIELQTGQTQFGRCRDDWGHWFGGNNSNPLWHFALDDHYLRRNPHLAAPDPRVPVPTVPGAAPVFPISKTLPRPNSPQAANHFTSACSPMIYRDDILGPAFINNTFVCEPVHNLVHREVMKAQGSSFTSQRAEGEEKSEFFASSDNWCRPVFATTGPDGAIWIADMYRHIIEHPQWIPKYWQDSLDLRAGRDRGRIYRVYPTGAKLRPLPTGLVPFEDIRVNLENPNGWWRDRIQQGFLWECTSANGDPNPDVRQQVLPLLEETAMQSAQPLARLHALHMLAEFGPLPDDVLQKALLDRHPGVRRHVIRLCEPQLNNLPKGGAEELFKMAGDGDAQVRMQLAYTLGVWDHPKAGQVLAELAIKNADDRFISAAVMSSVTPRNLGPMLLTVLQRGRQAAPPAELVENLWRLASAFGDDRSLISLLTAVSTSTNERYEPWQTTALAGLLDALEQRNVTLTKLHQDGNADLKAAIQKLDGLFQAARGVVAKPQAAAEEQLLALRLLGRGLDRQKEDLEQLAGLLTPQTAGEMQAAAIAALGRLRVPQVPEALLRGWKGYGPALRSQAFDVLLRRPEWLRAVLDAIDRKQLASSELDASRRQRLLEHPDTAIRQRAAKLFADAIAPDRQKLIEQYQTAKTMPGDAARGSKVFAKTCAVCHKLGDVGHIVGPDLAAVGDKSPQGLTIAVLDPNRVVETRYVNYTALLKNGQSVSGILAAETGNSITLLAQEGKQQTILRSDLEELLSTGKSAMPEGVEKDVSPQDLADLIEFIRSATPAAKPKTFPGNKPEIVKPAADGSLLLSASTAEIYGTSLVLEKQHGNLGYWNSDDDQAVWSVEVKKAGKYAVWLDWALADSSAGKTFVLQAGTNELRNKAAGTGGWDHYKQAQVGEIVLSAGAQRLTFRAGVKLYASPLLDLKSIKLVPVE